MRRKLTITVEEQVYEGLHRRIGRRNISRFLNDLARPHVLPEAMEEGSRAMAPGGLRETDAAEWAEGLIGDVREAAKRLIDDLPEEASWDDILYELYVKQKIEAGLKAGEEGRVVPHEDVRRRLLGNAD
ncbi:MAG: hypothetical protein ACFCUQ_17335 [Kiloniellales bacterium]